MATKYLSTLNNSQVENMNSMIDVLIENGITNPFSISAILSVISKESGFKLSAENRSSKLHELAIMRRDAMAIGDEKALEEINSKREKWNAFAQEHNVPHLEIRARDLKQATDRLRKPLYPGGSKKVMGKRIRSSE